MRRFRVNLLFILKNNKFKVKVQAQSSQIVHKFKRNVFIKQALKKENFFDRAQIISANFCSEVIDMT